MNLKLGNTPADAGNSSQLAAAHRRSKKHPRRCGELGANRAALDETEETPPQMRGTPTADRRPARCTGNTPADAGNSSSDETAARRGWKHPRRCGELPRRSLKKSSASETPPQMRGTLKVVLHFSLGRGNTPADAGNSNLGQRRVWGCQKHPRRCGELLLCVRTSRVPSETPPQMRGTQQYIEFQPNQITIS